MAFLMINRKPSLNLILCHKKSLLMIIVTFVLLCLAIPTLHYFSLYQFNIIEPTITKVIKPLNSSISDDQEPARKIQTDPQLIRLVNSSLTDDQEGSRKIEDDQNRVNIRVKPDLCSGRYIYMHNLPEKFNQDLLRKCDSVLKWFSLCPAVENGGFGSRIRRRSWYATNQFMLSVIFHTRMKKYECLIKNASLASAFYVPFYAGLEIGQHLWDGFNSSVKDALALELVSLLREKSEWGRMFGRDHFFVAGRIGWDFRRYGNSLEDWGSVLLYLPEVKNMTMLTMESTLDDTNDVGVPYPTHFHPTSATEVFRWQKRVRSSSRRRTYLFSFAGAPRPNMSGSIRGELIHQCENVSGNRCLLVNCWNSGDVCDSPTHIVESFRKSVFCLQPPGDSYTRRSTFDSILAGCIPVFFHPKSAYTQYIWHLPKNYSKYSVFIPEDQIRNRTVSIEKSLSEISDADVSAMREEVIRLIPRIIYARNKLENIEDAFDVSLMKFFEKIKEHQETDSRRQRLEQQR